MHTGAANPSEAGPVLPSPASLRLLHTADWHLGQLFHNYDRDWEHARFLNWLLETLPTLRPDVLLLSGDVFDTVNPSALAQRRFFDFLSRAHAAQPSLQFLITAGNHDSAARLESPSDLLGALNIRIVGTVPRDVSGKHRLDSLIVPLKNAQGQVAALAVALPFLRHSDLPATEGSGDPYPAGVRALYELATTRAQALRDAQYPGVPLIALGHCHVMGGEESRDSERRLVIGGSEALAPDVFPSALAYVALGHLHKPQSFDGGRIRYCGSPLPLSFTEAPYKHQILLVELQPGRLNVEAIPVPRATPLLRLPARGAAPLSVLLEQIAAHAFDDALPSEQHPFVELAVLDDGPDPGRRHALERALEGKAARLASIKLLPPAAAAVSPETGTPMPDLEDLSVLDPVELLRELHQKSYGTEPDAELLRCLHAILTEETPSTA